MLGFGAVKLTILNKSKIKAYKKVKKTGHFLIIN